MHTFTTNNNNNKEGQYRRRGEDACSLRVLRMVAAACRATCIPFTANNNNKKRAEEGVDAYLVSISQLTTITRRGQCKRRRCGCLLCGGKS